MTNLGQASPVKYIKKIFLISPAVRVHLWDLSGQLEYAEVRSELYGGSQGCILVFDVTNRNSFDSLDYWLKEAVRHQTGPMHTVVVANKVGIDWYTEK